MQISRVKLAGNWMNFFNAIPGWEQTSANSWIGPGARFLQVQDRRDEGIDFVIGNRRYSLGFDGSFNERERASISKKERVQSSPALVHFAIDCPYRSDGLKGLVDGNQIDLKEVLSRKVRFDPAVRLDVDSAHYFEPLTCYLTERFLIESERIVPSHIGFECTSSEQIDEVAAALEKSDCKITVHPQNVDGSYLFHFIGPDEREHDFYCPGPSLNSDIQN